MKTLSSPRQPRECTMTARDLNRLLDEMAHAKARFHIAALVLVEAARKTAEPCKQAVGERGVPPTGRSALVRRRGEKRVTGAHPHG